MAGYSSTQIKEKLGISDKMSILLVGIDRNVLKTIGLKKDSTHVILSLVSRLNDLTAKDFDYVHLFTKNYNEFKETFLKIIKLIKKDGMIWISWPKGASKIKTDMNENRIRDFVLLHGLVDVKVCAIDETWSGLKIVWRKENR